MSIQAFDFSVNLLRALLWQYNDAARLEALLRAKQAWYDENQTAFWTDWVRDVFDLRTANDFGLSVWAIILGLPLVVEIDPGPGDFFGFGPDRKNFNNGNFSPAGGIPLSTAQRRIALRLRYYQLTTRPSVTQANRILADVFGPGIAYVTDGLDMTIRYAFTTPPGAQLEFVLNQYDLLPRPAGVHADYVILGGQLSWGFGPFHRNFDNGNFYHA